MDLDTLITQLETISSNYAKKFDIERTPDWFLLKLTEELGELIQSYLKYIGQARVNGVPRAELKQDLEDELADVLGMTLLVANNHNIDLQDAIARKWLIYLKDEEVER
ncbi:MAG: pyrophosphatase [Chloroflexi bacterium]|nr:pyrophosphatase [Chloroflexota bacterium]